MKKCDPKWRGDSGKKIQNGNHWHRLSLCMSLKYSTWPTHLRTQSGRQGPGTATLAGKKTSSSPSRLHEAVQEGGRDWPLLLLEASESALLSRLRPNPSVRYNVVRSRYKWWPFVSGESDMVMMISWRTLKVRNKFLWIFFIMASTSFQFDLLLECLWRYLQHFWCTANFKTNIIKLETFPVGFRVPLSFRLISLHLSQNTQYL